MDPNGDGWNLKCRVCGKIYERSDEDVLSGQEIAEQKKKEKETKKRMQAIHRNQPNPGSPGKKIGA